MTVKDNKLLAGVRAKDVVIVREALSEGFDPNEADVNGWTAFHEAVSSGSSSITLAFLRRGASPNLQDRLNRNGCLHIAAKKGYTKIVQMLLDNSANIELKNLEGKTAEAVATAACKELLQRKRIELLMRTDRSRTGTDTLTKSYKDGSVLKLNPARSASPAKKQGPTSASHDSMSSLDGNAPSPGQIKLSFEYNRKQICLKVNILEIKDLKLPTVHNFSHIYVKCCLIPDKDKETKGKTSSFKIDSEDMGYQSRGSSASSQSSTGSYSSIDSDVIAEKIMSVLKKRPHLHSKKSKNEVKSVMYSQDGDLGRISFSIYESLTYDGLVLRKLNSIMSECQIYVRVLGRNRWTSKGTTIAETTIPLPVALKKLQTEETFFLNYVIDVPVTPEERKVTQMNQSWESREGRQFTGRSLAWNFATESPETSQPQSLYKAPSVPDFPTSKKHRKHKSKASRFLKGELNLFKGRPNDRYNRNAKHMGSQMTGMDNPENPCSDKVEFIGDSANNSLSYNTSIDRQSSQRWNASQSVDNIFDVFQVDGVTAPQPCLKYSRAFGEQSTGRSARRTREEDVSIEDVDEDFEQELSQTQTKLKTRASRY